MNTPPRASHRGITFALMALLAWAGACVSDNTSGGDGSGGVGSAGRGGAGGAGGLASERGGAGGGGSGGARGSGGVSASGGASSTSRGSSVGGSAGAAGSGGSSTGGTSGGGGTPSTLANFATMHEIVFTLCGGSGCHQPGDTPPALLDDAKLYSTLTTFVSKKCGNRVLVKPGSPQDSAFYLAQAGQCGSSLAKMPFGCMDQCTPPDYLEGIRQWILNGAPQN